MVKKNLVFPFMKRTFLILLFSISLIEFESSLSLTLEDIEKVCTDSDEYVYNFFSEDDELPEEYNELDQIEIEKGNDTKIISLILLSENAEAEYENAKINKLKVYSPILLILIVFYCIIIIIFEIHFICRISYGDIDKEKEKKTVTCFTFTKIHPFGFFKYSFMGQKECDKYFNEYKSQKEIYNKKLIISFFITILILMIGSIFLVILNLLNNNKTKKSIDNMTCTLMSFLYEVKIKPIRQSSFLGFDNVNTLLTSFSEKLEAMDIKITTLENNFVKCKSENTRWVSAINEIQNKLSDQKSMEFYLYGLPSDPNNMNFSDFSLMGDISKAIKHLFQLKVIYNYYPADTKGKTLYDINNFFNEISEPVVSEIKLLRERLILHDPNNKESENYNIYQNVVSKFNNILSLYIKKFQEIYFEKIDQNLKNDLKNVYTLDLILALLLVLCISLFIFLFKNVCYKNCYSFNKIISTLLMNFIFVFFLLAAYQLIIFQNINKKIIYIQDVWRGVGFLFDPNNINYLNDHPINNIIDIDLLINENNKYKNLFCYLNNIINNEGKLNGNLEIQTGPFNEVELSTANKTFNNLKDFLGSYNENNTNEYLYKYNLKISDIIKGGLQQDTKFQDISGTGFLGTYEEDPLTYLTYVNLRTRITTRTSWGFKDFDCDETWNISTLNYGRWVYTNSKEYLCSDCTNHYSFKNGSRPLLNYEEFTLEQAIERYSDLNNTEFISEFNGLVYYFNAVEFLRKSSFIEHLQKMLDYNMKLTEIQNYYFTILKENVESAKEIINGYLNLFDSVREKGDIASIIYCKFLREDLNFVLGEIKNGFLKKIKNVNKFHILMNSVNIIISIFMVIYYCIISYDLPYFKIENTDAQKIKQQNESSIKKIIRDNKNQTSLISHDRMDKNNQIISNNSKGENNLSIINKINGNTINKINNGEKENENNIISSQINNKTKLVDNLLKNEIVKKNNQMKNDGLIDAEDVDYPSKANIIGEILNNDGILKLNENRK